MVCAAVSPSGRIPKSLRRKVAIPAAFVTLTLIALALVRLDPAALCALPAFVLPALLALRRYPGEAILAVALRESRRGVRRRPRQCVSFASPAKVAVPRGGLLLACSLAVRPPPKIRLAAG